MGEFVKLSSVIALSSTKHFMGVCSAYILGYDFLSAVLLTTGSGMLGVFIYLYCWEFVLLVFRKVSGRKEQPKKVKVTKYRRRLVTWMNTYGLTGIAILTPIILTVPVGSILATSIEKDKWKIKMYMLGAFALWSTLLLGIFHLFNIDVTPLTEFFNFF